MGYNGKSCWNGWFDDLGNPHIWRKPPYAKLHTPLLSKKNWWTCFLSWCWPNLGRLNQPYVGFKFQATQRSQRGHVNPQKLGCQNAAKIPKTGTALHKIMCRRNIKKHVLKKHEAYKVVSPQFFQCVWILAVVFTNLAFQTGASFSSPEIQGSAEQQFPSCPMGWSPVDLCGSKIMACLGSQKSSIISLDWFKGKS